MTHEMYSNTASDAERGGPLEILAAECRLLDVCGHTFTIIVAHGMLPAM